MKRVDALQFARRWLDAWNDHDVARVVDHFNPDVVIHSPLAAQRIPETRGTLRGREAVLEYYRAGVVATPDLYFRFVEVCTGVDEVAIVYRNHTNLLVVETMLFDSDGLVREVHVSHGESPASTDADTSEVA